MKNSYKKFDLVLVCLNFRFHPFYLNIVKALAGNYSVCLYIVKDKKKEKTRKTENLYFDECIASGVHILEGGEKCECHVMLILQRFYREKSAHWSVINNINYKSVIPVLGTRFLHTIPQSIEMGLKRLWVEDSKVIEGLIKAKEEGNIAKDINLVKIELPYKKYPAFDFSDLNIDYIIADPTRVFLEDKANAVKLFQNMKKLLESIPKEKAVYLKPHNVRDVGSGVSSIYSRQRKYPLFVEYASLLLKTGIKKILKREAKWSNAINDIKIMNAQVFIEKRSRLLSEITEYYNFSIEHFLPFVKEGVITGISNTIYHSLYNRLPAYNCDDQPFTEESPNYDIYKSFYIPPCKGRLEFDPANFDLVRGDEKAYDMIELIKKELDQSGVT